MRTIITLLVVICVPLYVSAQYPQLVANLAPGKANATFGSAIAYGHKLLFTANAGTQSSLNNQLYITDGTVAGTQLLKTFCACGSNITGFTAFNNKVFFAAWDSATGQELWVTDGTPAGTTILKDIYSGPYSGIITTPVILNGLLYFGAQDSALRSEIWQSDGTVPGTKIAVDIKALSHIGGIAGQMIVANDHLFFPIQDSAFREALWVSDGTASGTHSVVGFSSTEVVISDLVLAGSKVYCTETIYPPSGWSNPPIVSFVAIDTTSYAITNLYTGNLQNSLDYTVFGGKLYFYGVSKDFIQQGNTVHGLWVTDGTHSGTQLVKGGLYGGCNNDKPINLTIYNNKLYFGGRSLTQSVTGLWVSDGSAQGTQIVAGGYISAAQNLTTNGTYLYFTAWDSLSNAINIWYTDGTATGTHMMTYKGANVALNYSCAELDAPVTLVDSILYFSNIYDTSKTGFELYTVQRATAVNEVQATSNSFRVFPNPASGNFQITLDLSSSEICDLDIYDMAGRHVQQLMNNRLIAEGNNVLTFAANAVADGVYMLRLRSKNCVSVAKMVVEH